jgi:hypothetical protein
MNRLMLVAAAVGMLGCGDDTNSSAMDMAVTVGDMSTSVPTCTAYCTALLTNCTGAPMSADGGTVGLAPFSSMNACKNACAKFTVGTLADTTGGTLGCRLYHAKLAAGSAANAQTHCPHASMSGGGVCGDRCANFCALATSICTVADGVTMPVFTSVSACMTACGNPPFAFDANEPEIVVDTPTLNCAFYHLGEAFTNPYDADAGTAATNSMAGGHCDDFNPNDSGRGCQ